MATKLQHGGARKGAGRIPSKDPKIKVWLSVHTSIIKKVQKKTEGQKKFKTKLYDFIATL